MGSVSLSLPGLSIATGVHLFPLILLHSLPQSSISPCKGLAQDASGASWRSSSVLDQFNQYTLARKLVRCSIYSSAQHPFLLLVAYLEHWGILGVWRSPLEKDQGFPAASDEFSC